MIVMNIKKNLFFYLTSFIKFYKKKYQLNFSLRIIYQKIEIPSKIYLSYRDKFPQQLQAHPNLRNISFFKKNNFKNFYCMWLFSKIFLNNQTLDGNCCNAQDGEFIPSYWKDSFLLKLLKNQQDHSVKSLFLVLLLLVAVFGFPPLTFS